MKSKVIKWKISPSNWQPGVFVIWRKTIINGTDLGWKLSGLGRYTSIAQALDTIINDPRSVC